MKTLILFVSLFSLSSFAAENRVYSNGPKWFIMMAREGNLTKTPANDMFIVGGGAYCIFAEAHNNKSSMAKIGCYGVGGMFQDSVVECLPTGMLRRPVKPNPPEYIRVMDSKKTVSLVGIYCEWER